MENTRANEKAPGPGEWIRTTPLQILGLLSLPLDYTGLKDCRTQSIILSTFLFIFQ